MLIKLFDLVAIHVETYLFLRLEFNWLRLSLFLKSLGFIFIFHEVSYILLSFLVLAQVLFLLILFHSISSISRWLSLNICFRSFSWLLSRVDFYNVDFNQTRSYFIHICEETFTLHFLQGFLFDLVNLVLSLL